MNSTEIFERVHLVQETIDFGGDPGSRSMITTNLLTISLTPQYAWRATRAGGVIP